MPFSAFVIARNLRWTAARISRCLGVLVAGIGGYLLLFGTIQYAYDWNFLVPEALRDILPERARGPFNNAVPYGIVVSMLVILALFLYPRARNRTARATLIVLAAGLVQCVVASKTRAVWIALPVALGLLLIRRPKMRVLTVLLAADLVLQLVLAAALGVDRLGVEPRLTAIEPVHDRMALSATASNMIARRPLLGYGFGIFTFQDDKADYYASWGGASAQSAVYPNNPHNDVLNVLILTGVVGLIPFFALMWFSWRLLADSRARWEQGDPSGSELAGTVQSIFLVLIVAGQFHSVMYMSYPQVLFFFLLGIVAADSAGADHEVATRRYADAAVPLSRELPGQLFLTAGSDS
jgi:O-antigen ligase